MTARANFLDHGIGLALVRDPRREVNIPLQSWHESMTNERGSSLPAILYGLLPLQVQLEASELATP